MSFHFLLSCLLLNVKVSVSVGETTDALAAAATTPEVTVNNNDDNSNNDNNGIAEELRKLQEQMRQMEDQSRQTNDIVLSILTEFRNQFASLYSDLRHTEGDLVQLQQEVNNGTDYQQRTVEHIATMYFTTSVHLEEVSS